MGKFTGLDRISRNFNDASKKSVQVVREMHERSQKVNMTTGDSGLQEVLVHEFVIVDGPVRRIMTYSDLVNETLARC